MKHKQMERWIRQLMQEFGAELWEIRQSKHYKVVFWIEGQKCTATFPRSPSDHRALKNQVAQMRRKVAEARENAKAG